MKDKFGYIYKITNKVNGKIYIGKTEETVERRFYEHLICARTRGKKSRLYSAIIHYGEDNFYAECIDYADSRADLNKKEIYYIGLYNSQNPDIGYNMTAGGDGGAIFNPKGYKTVNNGVKNLQVPPEELSKYLSEGWVLGGRKMSVPGSGTGRKWIHKGDIQKRVLEKDLDSYISDGWLLGYTDKGKHNLSKSHVGTSPWNKGGSISEEQKLFLRNLYLGSKWMNNGEKCLQVKKDDIELYKAKGWKFGQLKKGR